MEIMGIPFNQEVFNVWVCICLVALNWKATK